MTDKKHNTILICWNESEYRNWIKAQIEKLGFKVVLCSNSTELDCTNWSKITYIIVLCELKWFKDGTYSDMNGIKLAQYLRRDKDVKIPVLFVSFLSRKDILATHKDAKIICTPALQHEFDRLPAMVDTWVGKLLAMKGMTHLELQYTQTNFCNIEGLIGNMFHAISSRYTVEDLRELFELIQFVIDNKYNNLKPELLEFSKKRLDEYDEKAIGEIKDSLRTICDKIINQRML